MVVWWIARTVRSLLGRPISSPADPRAPVFLSPLSGNPHINSNFLGSVVSTTWQWGKIFMPSRKVTVWGGREPSLGDTILRTEQSCGWAWQVRLWGNTHGWALQTWLYEKHHEGKWRLLQWWNLIELQRQPRLQHKVFWGIVTYCEDTASSQTKEWILLCTMQFRKRFHITRLGFFVFCFVCPQMQLRKGVHNFQVRKPSRFHKSVWDETSLPSGPIITMLFCFVVKETGAVGWHKNSSLAPQAVLSMGNYNRKPAVIASWMRQPSKVTAFTSSKVVKQTDR